MKNKLLVADFNKETGESIVIISNKHGEFTGFAHMHPEDAPYISNLVGCRYAEARAHIACIQHQKNILNHKIKALQDFEKTIMYMKDYNKDSLEARQLRKRIYNLKRERTKLVNKITSAKQALKESMDKRDAYLKNVNKPKTKMGKIE
jgi:hypothetical protein